MDNQGRSAMNGKRSLPKKKATLPLLTDKERHEVEEAFWAMKRESLERAAKAFDAAPSGTRWPGMPPFECGPDVPDPASSLGAGSEAKWTPDLEGLSPYEARIEKAKHAYFLANDRKPADLDLALLTVDYSGGDGYYCSFLSFTSATELLDFVAGDLALSASDPPDEAELGEMLANAEALVAPFRKGTVSVTKLTGKSLDARPRDGSDSRLLLEWAGTFGDLCTSKTKVPNGIRAEFRGPPDDEDDPAKYTKRPQAPIAADERDGFVEFLKAYGA